MKYISKISLFGSAALAAALPVLAAIHLASAAGNGSATMYLSPASTTLAQGASFDLDIHEDSGNDTVNAAQAFLSYSSNLTFVSITSSPDFSVNATSTGGGGSVKVVRGTITPVTGDKIVATVRFTANTSGTGTVSFDSGSTVVRSNDNGKETMTFQNGTYNITSNAAMTLSPATKTVSQGTSFDVSVYENSGGDAVNTVQANLSYPADKLTFVSAAPNGTDWPVTAVNSGGSGLVKIGLGICPTCAPLTGSHLVATVKFTAANAGSAQVAFASGSGIIRSTDNTPEPSTNTGGSYTITAVSTGGSGGGGSTGGSGGGTTTNKSSSPAPVPPKTYTSAPTAQSSPSTAPADTAGPVISDIKVTNLTTKSATVSWTTSEPATSEVDFGLDSNYILSTSDATLATTHSLALDPKELVGHKTYHFIVKSTDNAGNQSVSKDHTFSTGGIQITTTEIAIAAGAVVLGGGAWLMAAAGGLKLGGGMVAASGGGIYVEPKPIILGGGTPPPQPTPVIHPQSAQPAAAVSPSQAPAKAPSAKAPAPSSQPQTPGKIVGPKSAPPPEPDNQTLPKWVKK
jgi:cell division septation protein DedD